MLGLLVPELGGCAVKADEEELVRDDLHGAEQIGRRELWLGVARPVSPFVLRGLCGPRHDPTTSSGPATIPYVVVKFLETWSIKRLFLYGMP